MRKANKRTYTTTVSGRVGVCGGHGTDDTFGLRLLAVGRHDDGRFSRFSGSEDVGLWCVVRMECRAGNMGVDDGGWVLEGRQDESKSRKEFVSRAVWSTIKRGRKDGATEKS